MIVSVHVTHTSAGGTAGLNNVVTVLENNIPLYVANMKTVEEYVIVRTCNRYELYFGCE